MPKFTHLHVHTHYSLLDGLAKVDDILDRAKELGMDSLAITDHGVLYGAIEFYMKAKEKGIKPIIGCEMYVTAGDYLSKNNTQEDKTRYHLILLAKNEKGYKNLMKLISIAHLDGFYYKPRINRVLLRKYAEGLIGLSACAEGEVPSAAASGNMEKAERLALEYREIFGKGDFYLELQHHPKFPKQALANQGLIEIARKHNLPLVATNDIHYVNKEDAGIQDILLCIQTNKKVTETNRMNLMDFELYLKSPEEMAEHFKDIPEVLSNTQEIADKCNLEIKLGETQLPYYDVPEGFTDETYLLKLTQEGLKKRFGNRVTDEHRKRMDYELSVIKKTGFASYFLIVQDFVNWARSQGIVVGPGRGSAAGSFVSYLIGITDIDPIKYDLLFERFLNPERISMPDVDMDFADNRRAEVLDYVRKRYGDDHVAQIITFGTMAARAAIRDAGRALGIPYDFCDKTAKLIPMFSGISEALTQVKEFSDLYKSGSDAKKLIDSAGRLEGVVRHASMHACGVVITKDPVTEYTPLQRIIGKEEGMVTQYSSSTKSSFIEKIGLLKMDFLGLKNLTIIQNTLRIVKKTAGKDILISDIPLDNKKTFALLQKAQTTGVFQLESSGMKRYLKLLKPNVFEDIIAMVALYRPGPMDWIPDFIARKHGEKEIRYQHPCLKDILEKTYGVAVYQEQVMQIAQALAGFTLGEADVLRKAMGKKVFALIQEQKQKFIEGCVRQGAGRAVGEKVFSFIEPFAGYGFNRCLAGETIITDPETGKQYTIEKLYARYKGGGKLPSVLTLDGTKLKKSGITKIYANGEKETYRITTRLGKSIDATANHPLLTFSGWKKLEELKLKDRIALNRNFPLGLKKYPIEKHQLTVLGYLMAEGNLCHPHSFYFYSKNNLEIKDYSTSLEKFKNTKATADRSKSAISIYAGRINLKEKSQAVEWVKSIGIHYCGALEKELPAFVFELNSTQLSLLIGKMFQGDGCVNIRRNGYPQIFYATSSEKLVRQLQHLLLRLNIISTLHIKTFKYRGLKKIGYTLTINRYDNISNFQKGPGQFLIGRKKLDLKKIIRNHPILNGKIKDGSARGSRDIIPCEIKDKIVQAIRKKGFDLRPFAKKYKFAEKLLFNDRKKKGYLRETVLNIGKILKNKELLDYAQSDIYWDEIVEIKKIGLKNTYDLTIKGTHNFVAGDFVVHNSHAACYAL
ncbi:MAG: DNA polymerase III subunit alpha, partial [Candidatus Moraniibacteriota bacterium]